LGLGPVTEIGAGMRRSLAILSDGAVFGWGDSGPTAIDSDTTQALPVGVPGTGGDDYLYLFGGDTRPDAFAFAPAFGVAPSTLVSSGSITVSGLGSGISALISVAGGEYSINGGPFTALGGTVTNGNSVVVRGAAAGTFATTTSATLNIGSTTPQSSTFYVRSIQDPTVSRVVPQVAAGDAHTYLLASEGFVYGAGYNGNGQLGNGTTLGLSTLRPVSGLADVVAVASGAFHGLALKRDGTVAAWGSNAAGQLGHGSPNSSERYFVEVVGLGGVASITAGKYHSVAVKADGTVWAWGLNAEGQVGDGSQVATRLAPVQVPGLTAVTAIAAGGRHTLALRADGTLVAWGANENGQLGDGSTAQRRSPVAVSGLSNVVAIAAGDAHSLALRSDGTVVAWGFNAFGQLGDASSANRLVPVAVVGLGSGVGLIAAGANHSMAVKVGGVLYTWGNNANSQLGNGNNLNQSTPSLIASPSSVVAIAGGARHTAVITSERKLYLWGDNFFGQVGNRSGNYSPHSASLNVLRGDSDISTGTSGSGGSVGTGSSSGSSVLEIDGQATGFDFGNITSGALKTVTGKYRNQAAQDNINAIAVSITGSAFGLSSTDCPATLAPDAECTFSIRFNPASALTYSGELVIASSVVGSPEKRSLNGRGLAPSVPAISFAKSGLDFPPQTVGSATAPAAYALSNSGNATLNVTSVSRPIPDFTTTHNCTGVAPGASCSLAITFTPTASGTRSAVLRVYSNASGSPHSVTVSGTGAPTTAPAAFALTVTRAGAGSGSVASTSPATPSINCGATCNANFAPGAAVSLAATPATNSTFTGWSGACSGSGICSVTMNSALNVSATFDSVVVTAPGAPQNLAATPGNTLAAFTFAPPANDGGSPITGYSVTCSPGNLSVSGNALSLALMGLANGTTYSCTARASNSAGEGDISPPVDVTPNAAPLALFSVVSRKTHGTVGDFNLPIDAAQPLNGAITVEPRMISTGHQLVFQFNAPITVSGSASALDPSSLPVGSVAVASASNEVIVTLTGVPDNKRLTVSLTGVNGSGSAAASLAFLLGDVRESRSVTAGDILPTKARTGQAANAANFAYDVDLSGAIAANDLLTIKAASGRSAP
ncbi:MAG: choice-of-anchor D domain-containing protein, partial [Usitatibacter sp.]